MSHPVTLSLAAACLACITSTASAVDVLALSSGDVDYDTAAIDGLSAFGHTMTLGQASTLFDGTTDLSPYDVVLVLGHDYFPGMPVAGQVALRDYASAGGGLVTCEWLTYALAADAGDDPLAEALPVDLTLVYGTETTMTFTAEASDDRLGAGLADSMTFTPDNYTGTRTIFTARDGSTVFYRHADEAPAVVGWNHDDGRVLMFSTLVGPVSMADASYARLVSNALDWAAGSRRVFMLSTGVAEVDAMVSDALVNAGNTVVAGPMLADVDIATATSGIDVILAPVNDWPNCAIPEDVQQMIVDFVADGGGLVVNEWLTYMTASCSTLDTLAAALPVNPDLTYNTNSELTYGQLVPEATLNAGLPADITFVPDNVGGGTETRLEARDGATVYYTSSGATGGAGVVGWSYGAGRTMSLSTVLGPLVTANSDYMRLLTNAVAWADESIANPCDGDLDANGAVDLNDLLTILGTWGDCSGCAADINGDTMVDIADLLIVLGAWGDCP